MACQTLTVWHQFFFLLCVPEKGCLVWEHKKKVNLVNVTLKAWKLAAIIDWIDFGFSRSEYATACVVESITFYLFCLSKKLLQTTEKSRFFFSVGGGYTKKCVLELTMCTMLSQNFIWRTDFSFCIYSCLYILRQDDSEKQSSEKKIQMTKCFPFHVSACLSEEAWLSYLI